MAVINLSAFNTITLAASTPDNLVAPLSGRYDLTLLNAGTAAIYVSDSNTVGANATSFELPPNLAITVVVFGPTGIWVNAGGTAGLVSALLQPRGQ